MSKKKNSRRSHHNRIPVEMFAANARLKKYKKDQMKAMKGE